MAKKKSIKERLSSKGAVRIFWILVISPFALLFFLLAITAMGAFGKLPSFEELENPKSNLATEIYSEDGKMIGSFFVENRSYVDYSELNDTLVAALVSTEDMRFYSHAGIDFISLARVGLKTILMLDRSQGGGSTITQQLAKNLFPRGNYRGLGLVQFKLKEWITAVKLEYNYTKEEIIAMYLNTVAYGSNAFGIKAAARTFFDKEPSELTINEAATLAGVVNAPTRYSPVSNPERSIARRNTVLSRMRACNFLTRQQQDSLSKIPIELNFNPISHNVGQGTYFREMLRGMMTAKKPTRKQFYNDWDYKQALKEWESNPLYGWCEKNKKADGEPYNIYKDGLKIYTTINSTMQQYAEEALWDRLENNIQPAMDGQIRRTNTIFRNLSKSEVEALIDHAVRYSDRHWHLTQAEATQEEIDKAFSTPTKMKVFTYKGDIDTLLTPRDSIIHHKKIMRASLVAMDPSNGHVKAYVGGPDYRYFKYDMAKQGKRQVGSTIKPFVYTFAIDHLGFTPCTMVPNVQTTIETETGTPWQPQEASRRDDIYTGELKPLRWGMANSRNNYSAWIMKQAKQPAAVADFIHKMGIKSYIDPVYALCLGTPDFSLYELVGAYTTFANRGVFTEPIFVTRVEDKHGNLISAFMPQSTDAISEQTAYTMLGMLQNVVNAGTAGRVRYQYQFKGELGGKTGTSQENRDAWYIGVAPKLVAGAWVGGEDQSVNLWTGGEGSARALPIYGEFMKRIYNDPRLGISETDTFPMPVGAINYNCDEQQDRQEVAEPDEFFD